MTLILSGTDGVSDIDGTAATPAIRGTDANTGIFFPAADTIAFSEGGAEAMRIDSSGRVGIGETSPTFRLQVAGNNGSEVKVTRGTNDCIISLANNAGSEVYVGPSVSSPLVLQTNNTERMRINAGAPILCLSGGNTSATGTGIAFPATQSASTDANTLDDYEEGTWTPAWSFSTSGSAPLVVQYSSYTKIGRLVTASVRLYTSPTSSPTGNATLTGLPFTSSSQVSGFIGEIARWATDMPNLKVNTVSSASYLEFSKNATNAAGLTPLAGSDFNSTDVQNIINITVTYIT